MTMFTTSSEYQHDRTPSDASSVTIRLDDPQESYALMKLKLNEDSSSLHEYESDEELDPNDFEQVLLGRREEPAVSFRNTRLDLWDQVKDIVVETGPTLFLTTIFLIFAGELLQTISHWKALSCIDELIVIIPVVLNLKGNLELNLSARLSTAANMGKLDKPSTRRAIILGNLSLLQVQATVVSFVAACVAFFLARILPPQQSAGTVITVAAAQSAEIGRRLSRPSNLTNGVLGGFTEFALTASSTMLATCLSSMFLGSFMSALIVVCRRFGIDPDNIAPPIAACLGDIVALCVLGGVATLNLFFVGTPGPWIIVLVLSLAGVGWAYATRQNPHVKDLLLQGWLPLFLAMLISCGTGVVLNFFVNKYEGFAMLSILITGLPGNVGAILASRLSTALHAAMASVTNLPSMLGKENMPARSSRVVALTLLCVTIPIEIIVLVLLHVIGWLHVPTAFSVFSFVVLTITLIVSLLLAQLMTSLCWKWNMDPDMNVLPLHAASIDLMGQLLLVAIYALATKLGLKTILAA